MSNHLSGHRTNFLRNNSNLEKKNKSKILVKVTIFTIFTGFILLNEIALLKWLQTFDNWKYFHLLENVFSWSLNWIEVRVWDSTVHTE